MSASSIETLLIMHVRVVSLTSVFVFDTQYFIMIVDGSVAYKSHVKFKAAIDNFMITMYQMIVCNVRGVTRSHVPTENYHPTL